MSSSFHESRRKLPAHDENVISQDSVPMKIACVIHSLDGGGAERVMAGLASRLAMRHHDVDLITLDNGQRQRHPLSDLVKWHPLDVLSTTDHRVSLPTRLKRLRAAIIVGGYDVVLSFCDSTNLLVMLSTRCMRRPVPIVLSERSDPAQQSLGAAREWLRDRMYPKADAVIGLSDEVATTLQSRMHVQPIVIPSAVEAPPHHYSDMRLASHRRPVTPPIGNRSSVRLIAIGRLEPEKGVDRLLSALATLNESGNSTDWRLKILGDGSEMERLRSFAEEHGIESRIEFCGWVDSVWPHLAESDVFVLPSLYEGFPSAMLEAMAGGLAVLAVDAGGGVRSVIRHGENAWLVDNEAGPLLDGLRTLLSDAALRGRLANSAPEVCDQFGWDAMVDAYERVLRGAARSSSGGTPVPTDGDVEAHPPAPDCVTQ
ncbi:glycosyltransferase involved in cell wall biosynthesis [Rhodopirellula rubra]|uniref:Glycosyltransferase involved in cell wall biosynthesis n=1 Tax=Aporhodopirellula rubra TaxID=980271 RepID=A0A7W5H6P8_9BACT|nr:glycosyltransferase [Aporhodopirellula rubra]MBB3207175.1 glycosyltransferase involved in cell wall biosynthesis [Aporhodopirellula rubra]